MGHQRSPLLWAALVLALATLALAEERQLLFGGDGERTYRQGDPVPLWASKVGPFTNPR